MNSNRLPADVAALVAEYQSAVLSCEYCGTTNGPIVVDHIIPKSRGGALTRANLASACEPCNQKKAAQLGWMTLDGRRGCYDPVTGPLKSIKRKRRGKPVEPANAFKGHSGSGFL